MGGKIFVSTYIARSKSIGGLFGNLAFDMDIINFYQLPNLITDDHDRSTIDFHGTELEFLEKISAA